jgi:hypothetical protein
MLKLIFRELVNLVISLRVALILTITTLVLLNSGLVAALNQDQATARVLFSSEILPAGQAVTGAIFFGSTSSDPLVVTAVSIHFDWMPSGQVVGYQLTTPFTVESGGNHLFDSMQIHIPLNIESGSHTYYIGIDGTENGTPFSWDSPVTSINVAGGTGSVTTTPSSTNSGGEQPEGEPNLLLYGAIAAVVVIVVLLIVVFMMRKKHKESKPIVNQEDESQTKPSTPEKKPNPEQDFNI